MLNLCQAFSIIENEYRLHHDLDESESLPAPIGAHLIRPMPFIASMISLIA